MSAFDRTPGALMGEADALETKRARLVEILNLGIVSQALRTQLEKAVEEADNRLEYLASLKMNTKPATWRRAA